MKFLRVVTDKGYVWG